MLKYTVLLIFVGIISCKSQKNYTYNDYKDKTSSFMSSINQDELKEMLYTYASDEFEGREAGEPGEDKATEFIRDFYKKNGIAPAAGTTDYYQIIPAGTFSRVKDESQNVVAFIEGTDLKDEYIVVSAHLDHIGAHNGQINNGADDDGSGTVAVMQIAQAFEKAVKKGYRPRRSIVFLHVTAEEKGLYGSQYYVENPLYPLNQTIADLNIDMIGRVDEFHSNNENYIYLIGSNMLSSDLHNRSEKVNSEYSQMNLDYKYADPSDPNRFYYRSDHYNFAKNNIPVIFYFNGTHEDYHQPSDTPDKINYPLLAKRAQLIFAMAWELANGDEKPMVDKAP